MITSTIFKDRHYAILGLARTGMATLDMLLASGAKCTVWDSREDARNAVSDKADIGDPMVMDLSGFDALIVSPGVPLNSHPIAQRAAEANLPIIGDTEIFAEARASLPPHRVVGITGTNGKSTTTALVNHICKSAGFPSLMGGNIGLPILSREPLTGNARGLPVYVLELSSYQIDLTQNLACDVAALINLTPDHLDRYNDGFSGYAASKARLFAMQNSGQLAVFGNGDKDSAAIAEQLGKKDNAPDVIIPDAQDLVDLQSEWPALKGPHNLQNAAIAVAIVTHLGVTKAEWQAAMRTFGGLPHRMEIVTEHDGVLYVNDSKATNAASSAPALAAFPPVDGRARIHWIAGGLPKGKTLEECEEFLGHIAHGYTIGEAGPLFADLLAPHMPVTRSELLCQAVRDAMANAQQGDVILLSPACASFDQFRDFEQRGDHFKEAVHKLISIKADSQT